MTMTMVMDDMSGARRGTCCRPTGASRSRSCAARACVCTTPRGASISTCCRASAWRRSATRTRAGARDRRAGADADPHVEPVLPPAAGPARRAAGEPVRPAARVLLQQRHRSGRGVPEVRAPLLVHARRAARRDHRARRIVPRPDVRRAVGHVGRALPRAVRAAAARRQVRARQRSGRARRRASRDRPRRSSPSRFRAKAASGR